MNIPAQLQIKREYCEICWKKAEQNGIISYRCEMKPQRGL